MAPPETQNGGARSSRHLFAIGVLIHAKSALGMPGNGKFQAETTAPGLRTAAQPLRSSKQYLVGAAVRWRRITEGRPIASGSPWKVCTCLRTKSENLFPHLWIR